MLAGLFALLVPSAMGQISLLHDTFTHDTLSKDGLARDDVGWQAALTSLWKIGLGNRWMYNTSHAGAGPSDGAVAQIIPLGELGLKSENQLKVELSYVSWGGVEGDNLFIHLWGLVDIASRSDSAIVNLHAQNGNMWVEALNNGFKVYNLLDGSPFTQYGEGRADSAAIKLMNQDTASSLSEHAQVFSATLRDFGALADYDYLVMGITRDPAEGRGNGTAFYDVSLTAEVAVPEPSQLATLISAPNYFSRSKNSIFPAISDSSSFPIKLSAPTFSR